MPLTALLYRCPRCGHDPMAGHGDEARCPSCGVSFRRGDVGATLRLTDPSDPDRERVVPAASLTHAIAALGGPLPSPHSALGDGALGGGVDLGVVREAAALRSRSLAEEPVHFRGRLLGFAERQGEGEDGIVRLTDDEIVFLVEDQVRDRWRLIELRALQSSSSLIQLSTRSDELVQFRFHSDSPRRWEELLRIALQKAWDGEGRGTIMEFQPRIVTR